MSRKRPGSRRRSRPRSPSRSWSPRPRRCPRPRAARPCSSLTAGIGLLHGLGFSFALRQMRQLDGPHLAISLGAFNLGVEVGQIAFAAAVWSAMLGLAMRATPWQPRVKALAAYGCIAIATLWIVKRAQAILAVTS